MGPSVEQILVASILPPNFDIDHVDWSNITQEELDCMQLNACDIIFGIKEVRNDARVIWALLMEIYAKPECDDVEQAEEKSLEECSTEPVRPVGLTGQTSSRRGTGPMCNMGVCQDSCQASSLPESTPSNDEVDLCLMAKKKKKKKKAEKGKSQKIEVSNYACGTKSLPCVASLEKGNEVLAAQLEKLTSEHMALQATHKELESSQSSIEHVFIQSCDDLITQENDELMQEVERLKKELSELKGKSQVQPSQDNREIMVTKVEKGSTITYTAPQQQLKISKSKIQDKNKFEHVKCFNYSKIGNFASRCANKLKGKETLSKRQKSLAKKKVCYGCKKKGHIVATYPSATSEGGSDLERLDWF
uniref:CCHC-type domain-containing protein n=1 Tax=Setaria italica TaxID=4555 RepID=K3Y2R8_SETIT